MEQENQKENQDEGKQEKQEKQEENQEEKLEYFAIKVKRKEGETLRKLLNRVDDVLQKYSIIRKNFTSSGYFQIKGTRTMVENLKESQELNIEHTGDELRFNIVH